MRANHLFLTQHALELQKRFSILNVSASSNHQIMPLVSHQFLYYKLRCILKKKLFLGGRWEVGNGQSFNTIHTIAHQTQQYVYNTKPDGLSSHTAQSKIRCQ
jgi:hypothetical protein